MICLLLLVGLHGAAWSPAQPSAPPLPTLVLDSYPPDAREAIARAHREAAAHPTAETAGALGRVLQAWEQWNAAHQAYTRAEAMAPRTFEWPYLDAVVLQRQARSVEAAARLEAALAVSPDYLPARVKLAESLLEAGRLDESRRLFSAMTDPASAPAVAFGLGRIAAAQGQHEAAVDLPAARDRAFPRIRRGVLRARALVSRAGTPGRGAGGARASCAVRGALAGSARSGPRRRHHAA